MEADNSSPGLDDTSDSEPVVSAFVACGVAPGPLEPLLAGRRAAPADLVIDDVAVVLKGEECPPGYELLEHTPDGQRASLNHGDVLGKQLFLAIRRAPLAEAARPLTGLALIFADRGEEPPPGFEPVRRTVGGLGASLNAGGAGREILLCVSRELDERHRRAPLRDVAVLVRPKWSGQPTISLPRGHALVGPGAAPAHTVANARSLNAGGLGSDVYLCAARCAPCALQSTPLKPVLLDVLSARRPGAASSAAAADAPAAERAAAAGLPQALPHFCLPQGALLRRSCVWPTAHEFALTDGDGARLYGYCVTTWEPLPVGTRLRLRNTPRPAVSEASVRPARPIADVREAMRHAFADGASVELLRDGDGDGDGGGGGVLEWRAEQGGDALYTPKVLCVLSAYPFFRALRAFLCGLYRTSLTASSAPLEAHVASLLWECPLPPPGHIAVSIQVADETVTFSRPEPSAELPLAQLRLGALLGELPTRAALAVFGAACREHKLVLVSSYVSKLTAAAEALNALLWPMRWQGVYVPLLPDLMLDFLQSPVPFLLGIHADAYAAARALAILPDDAVVVDLDEGRVDVPPPSALPPAEPLPHEKLLIAALEAFGGPRRQGGAASPATEAAAEMAEGEDWDLAFPQREQGSAAAEVSEAREASQQAAVRHGFASYFALLLAGYQNYLRRDASARSASPLTPGSPAAPLIDEAAFLASRPERERPFVGELIQTQAFVRFIEERSSASGRDAELALFDQLAAHCEAAAAAAAAEGEGAAPALPTLPAVPARRVYSVPPPVADGGTHGPHETWPQLRASLLPPRRPIRLRPVAARRPSVDGADDASPLPDLASAVAYAVANTSPARSASSLPATPQRLAAQAKVAREATHRRVRSLGVPLAHLRRQVHEASPLSAREHVGRARDGLNAIVAKIPY